ncbi:MAG: two-component system chemotaxis sensor kinase CheA [Candidatus Pelagisphaera sp.]|jgi:two-component system chemotaxis sensor kinase CheA
MSDDLTKQLINDFIIESCEGLDSYEIDILKFENGDFDDETINNIFRVIHTVKGTAGCLGLGRLEKTAHIGENLLTMVRDGRLKITQEMITPLLELSDALRELMGCLESTGEEGDKDYSALLECLDSLQNQSKNVNEESVQKADAGFGFFEEDKSSETVEAHVEDDSVESETLAPVAQENDESNDPVIAKDKPSIGSNSIRVDVGLLDRVMNMVGELVLARNQIVANSEHLDPTALQTAAQRLNIITRELQEGVMKTRMQQIGSIWATLPRVVRDVSGELGKKVRLVMDGQTTELDRTVIEAIKDPLTHIIRNSIDHGIEDPAIRSKNGKAEEGLLSLRAFHEGGQVNIEIMDDGAGINLERVKEKAIKLGMITSQNAKELSDREATDLIFLPGLSSAEKVSNVSGRGVGMDVVRTNVEKTGGSIDLQTHPGQGTTIRIKIPLTLAIIPALIVTSGGSRFAIPQASLLELVRLESEQAKAKIEMLYGVPVYRLRGQILPLAYLSKSLNIEEKSNEEDDSINIIVLEADGRQFGLVVDEINDTEEIVVKPLSKQLKDINAFAGATIMGDGKVALILDVLGYAEHSKVVSERSDRALAHNSQTKSDADAERQSHLIFKVGSKRTMAIPLAQAARLEEFPREEVERTGSQEVVQYRGQILPLLRVSDYIDCHGSSDESDPDILQVVVFSENERSVGLVVDSITDIVEESITVQRKSTSQGLLGSAVIQDRVTELLDVPDVVRRGDPNFYNSVIE